jgi:hypothetical protein
MPFFTVARAASALSVSIGTLTSVVVKFLKCRFPKDYFKNIHVNSSLSSRDIEEDATVGSPGVFLVKNPAMSITPNLDTTDSTSIGLAFPWQRTHTYIMRDKSNYVPVLYTDEEHILGVWAIPDRIRVNFEVKMKVKTPMDAMDLFNHIKNTFPIGIPYFLDNIKLEAEVPSILAKNIHDILEWDPDDDAGFKAWMSKRSGANLSWKRNLSTGNDVFLYKYPVNIMFKMEQPDLDQQQKNMVDGDHVITFMLVAEIWTPSGYILSVEDLDGIPGDPQEPFIESSNGIVWNYTISTRPAMVWEEKSQILWEGYISDVNTSIDTVDLSDVVPLKVKQAIEKMTDEQIAACFGTRVWRDETELAAENIEIDYKTWILSTLNPLPNASYYVGVWADLGLLSEFVAETYS